MSRVNIRNWLPNNEAIRIEHFRHPDGKHVDFVKTLHCRSGKRDRKEVLIYLGPIRVTFPRELRWHERSYKRKDKRTWRGK